MKARLFLWMLLAVALGCAGLRAEEGPARKSGREKAAEVDAQAEFFQRYPDLKDEREVVEAAARKLAEEGAETQDAASDAALLARRTREILERRSPQQWQQKAVSLFPEVGEAGSEFNLLFVKHFNELKATSPQFLEEPSWPVLLARRCADELKAKTLAAAGKVPAKTGPPSAPPGMPSTTAPATPASLPRSNVWLSSLNLILLLAIIVQPARLLFRWRRAFSGSDGPVTLWQRALGPAAWAYLLVALIALVRTFFANADQRFVDRFGITLFVSLVAGAAVALPIYGVTLLGFWWRRQRTPPVPKGREPEMHASAAGPAASPKR